MINDNQHWFRCVCVMTPKLDWAKLLSQLLQHRQQGPCHHTMKLHALLISHQVNRVNGALNNNPKDKKLVDQNKS